MPGNDILSCFYEFPAFLSKIVPLICVLYNSRVLIDVVKNLPEYICCIREELGLRRKTVYGLKTGFFRDSDCPVDMITTGN